MPKKEIIEIKKKQEELEKKLSNLNLDRREREREQNWKVFRVFESIRQSQAYLL